MNEARRRRFPALCGTSLRSSTSSLEISKHLQEQRCGADTAVSFVQCSPVKIPSLLVTVETVAQNVS